VNVDAAGVGRGCTGVLVAASWVLTARSCLDRADQPATLGVPSRPVTVTVDRSVAVTWMVPHENRDVALLRLANPITSVTPVALSSAAPAVGDVLRVVGYGRTANTWVPDQKHAATVSVTGTDTTTLSIAGTVPDAATTCKGDAGGPAVRESDGTIALVGIHQSSWQSGCLGAAETSDHGAVETRTDDLVGWINQNTPPVFFQDFNRDDKADIIGRYSDGVLRLYAGNGTGGISSTYTTIATSWNNMSELFSPGDFNGDGKPDIIGRYSDGVLRLYPGNGTGGISSTYTTIATSWNNMSELF